MILLVCMGRTIFVVSTDKGSLYTGCHKDRFHSKLVLQACSHNSFFCVGNIIIRVYKTRL